jgi:hypothetical protein
MRRASFAAKLGAGLLRVLGGLPQLPRVVRLVEERARQGPEAGRAHPLSVVFVILDPIPNDLVVGVEVAMGGTIAHPGHPLPFDLGVMSAFTRRGRPYLRRRFVRDLQIENECALECPVRNETRGRSPLARGPQKLPRLSGAGCPPAGPPNRQNSRTRLRLRKGM